MSKISEKKVIYAVLSAKRRMQAFSLHLDICIFREVLGICKKGVYMRGKQFASVSHVSHLTMSLILKQVQIALNRLDIR